MKIDYTYLGCVNNKWNYQYIKIIKKLFINSNRSICIEDFLSMGCTIC